MPRRIRFVALVVVAVGAALQAMMGLCLPVTGDERNAVGMGYILVHTGRTTVRAPGGGVASHSPAGAFVNVAFGASQLAAPGVVAGRALVFLLMVAGSLCMAASVRSIASDRLAVWFLAAYWVAPWTVYHSAMAWEHSLIMALSATIFCACIRLRERAGAGASAALAWSLIAAFQTHGQFLILAISSAVLAWRRRIRIGAAGAVVGLLLGSVTLWPGLFPRPFSPFRNAVIARYTDAHLGFGLTEGYPLLRAAGFWLRMGSSDLNRQLRQNRFYRSGGAGARPDRVAARAVTGLAILLSFGSVLAAAAASLWFFRRPRSSPWTDAHEWLRSYSMAMLVGLMVAAAASPVCIQGYHSASAQVGAAIPFAAWCEHLWSTGGRRSRALIAGLYGLRVLVIVLVALGYELGGP